ncbi:hypothetical protein [Streptomyces johnsoniae]|uniref:Uncharacterized protein n=1 Tax=Streptomyces johnsoniae TaxID=3075532 RepID=A0ABU2S0B7_9ACTN|nr:hypothetical protein [Streptomyces sp. DSM 41886]MDT0442357.1 hypothetical protein [Streptomyces sp. DSM 41886]
MTTTTWTETHPRTRARTDRKELSRHATGDGTAVWSRCSCGRLHMVFTPADPRGTALTAGGATPGCPDCP